MKLKIITFALIGVFFYSCSEKNNSNKKEEIKTITEQKNNVPELITEEKTETITVEKSNVPESITKEKLETITEQKNNSVKVIKKGKMSCSEIV
jgi:hypothetical protein